MRRQALALLALGGAFGLAACSNILGLKDLEPYPAEGGAEESGSPDAPEEAASDSPPSGDVAPGVDASDAPVKTDAREEDGAVAMDAMEEDATSDVSSDVPDDVGPDTTSDVVVTMDAPPDSPPDSPAGCEGGEVACGGTCTDLSSSQHHCGSCTHDCLGGSCSNGTCQPYLFAGNVGAPHDMVIANGFLYWVDEVNMVWACPTSSTMCTGPTAATGGSQPTRIAFDGTSCLYFTNAGNGTIGSYQVGSTSCLGPITGLQTPQGVAANGTDVFWTDTGKNQVGRYNSGGPNTLNLINSGSLPVAIAISGADAYWADYGIQKVDLTPVSGALSETTFQSSSAPWAFASAGSTLYWVDYTTPTGDVMVDASGTVTIVATMQDNPIRVGGDSNVVYWVDQGSSTTATGAVMRCSTSSLPCTPMALKSSLAQPEGLAVDQNDVFFGVVGSKQIWRVVR